MSRHVVRLCDLADMPEGSSRGFSLAAAGVRDDIFLVRTQAGLFGYRNSCPHTGGPLDWVPDQFLNLDGSFIQCATHAALFRIEDGLCVSGPCAGRWLDAVAVDVTGEQVTVTVEGSGGQ